MPFKFLSKDILGGAICMLLGAGVLAAGLSYGLGVLNQMGPGFIPSVIGALLILVGLIIAIRARPQPVAGRHIDAQRGKTGGGPEWRGWLCIVGGIFAFIVLGTWGGLAPAAFISVFVSAMGDRNNSPKSAALLAAGLTVFCVLVFHFLLSLQFPLFRWG